MKKLALIICLMATPVVAQETGDEKPLMQQGLELFFKGLTQELDPAMDELDKLVTGLQPHLRNMARTMGPALADMLNSVEDWSHYQPPEVLPNGDIIIRRKPDAPAPEVDL